MKPVAIFRCARTEGPGYFATVLERRSIAWKLFALDEVQPVPKDARAFSGMAFMGGPMSVNDDRGSRRCSNWFATGCATTCLQWATAWAGS